MLYDLDDPDCAANQSPLAEPNGPYSGMVGEEVAVNAAGSLDIDEATATTAIVR